MYRVALAVSLAAAVTCGVAADVYFTNDVSSINLLERWNKDGTYGLGVEASFDLTNAARLVNYSSSDRALRLDRPAAGTTVWHEITYTFDEAVYIGELACAWATNGDGPFGVLGYEWVDEHGVVMAWRSVDTSAVGAARMTGVKVDPVVDGPRLTQSVTLRFAVDSGKYGNDNDMSVFNTNEPVGLVAVGAYLAEGESLKMDGTYNVFWQERNLTADSYFPEQFKPVHPWTDHAILNNGSKPSWADNQVLHCTWEFSQEYEFFGMTISQYETGRFLANAMLEVWSEDWEENDGWRTVWGPVAQYRWVDNGRGYMILNDLVGEDHVPIIGTKVRLSWGTQPESGIVEMSEFQLFGKIYEPIPEPATMTLLALGGLAMLRRRR